MFVSSSHYEKLIVSPKRLRETNANSSHDCFRLWTNRVRVNDRFRDLNYARIRTDRRCYTKGKKEIREKKRITWYLGTGFFQSDLKAKKFLISLFFIFLFSFLIPTTLYPTRIRACSNIINHRDDMYLSRRKQRLRKGAQLWLI